MAIRDFREYARALSPAFLQRFYGERLVGLIGILFDGLTEGAMLAVLLRNFQSRTFSRDVLSLLGNERMLPRNPLETDAAYQARVEDAWRIWERAGSKEGLREQLALVGAPTVNVYRNGDVDFDGQPDNWSRVFIELRPLEQGGGGSPGHLWHGEGTYGDGQVLGDGGTIGTNASLAEVEAVRRIVRTMRPGHIDVPVIAVALSPAATFAPDGTWGEPANRPSTYAFWEG